MDILEDITEPLEDHELTRLDKDALEKVDKEWQEHEKRELRKIAKHKLSIFDDLQD